MGGREIDGGKDASLAVDGAVVDVASEPLLGGEEGVTFLEAEGAHVDQDLAQGRDGTFDALGLEGAGEFLVGDEGVATGQGAEGGVGVADDAGVLGLHESADLAGGEEAVPAGEFAETDAPFIAGLLVQKPRQLVRSEQAVSQRQSAEQAKPGIIHLPRPPARL
jgi:hypothetical protein